MRTLRRNLTIVAPAAILIATASWLWVSYVEPKTSLFDDDKLSENFAHMDRIFPANYIPASSNPHVLGSSPQPLITHYTFEGALMPVRDFMERSRTTGLLIIKNGEIAHQYLHPNYTTKTKATSFSVAKSFVATLVGIAQDEGLLSIQDKIASYLPTLSNSGFANATIEDVLQMSSGVAFSEVYDDRSTDSFTIFDKMFIWGQSVDSLTASYGSARQPGTQFEYASINTQALSMLLREVYRKPLAEILFEKIWEPAGMSDSAFWSTDLFGAELGFMSLNATLTDFAKLGLLMLGEGKLNNSQIVSAEWVQKATRPARPFLERGQIYGKWGYQHQWWLPMGSNTDYAAIGIWGQMIYVNPELDVVIVKTATDADFSDHEFESIELFRQIAASLN